MSIIELDYTRASQWHSAGKTGCGIKVAIHELSDAKIENHSRYIGKVADPFGTRMNGTYRGHIEDVTDTVFHFAPHVEIHLMSDDYIANLNYCYDNYIDIYNMSTTATYNTPEINAIEAKVLANGTTFVCAAGNDGDKGLRGMSHKKTWISIGALRMQDGKPIRTYYSSYDKYGDNLDCMGFGDFLISELDKGVTGTSFASPSVVGLLALYKQWYKETYDKKPTFDEVFSFIKHNCEDLEDVGYDTKTGFGIFRLPDISTMPKKTKLELWINNKIAKNNGSDVQLAIAPQLINSRTMVGLRDVAQLFGAIVTWNQSEKKITIVYNNETLILLIGNDIAKKNGVNITLNIAPLLVGGSTMVGLSDVAKLFGFKIDWDNITKKITITN